MTLATTGKDFMPQDRQLIRRTLSEALFYLSEAAYGSRDFAKRIAKAWGIERPTAENLRKGHLSITTLDKAADREGWALWHALGVEKFGETFAQYEERRLHLIIQEAENARENLVRLRTRREELDARAAQLDPSRSWSPAQFERDRHG